VLVPGGWPRGGWSRVAGRGVAGPGPPCPSRPLGRQARPLRWQARPSRPPRGVSVTTTPLEGQQIHIHKAWAAKAAKLARLAAKPVRPARRATGGGGAQARPQALARRAGALTSPAGRV